MSDPSAPSLARPELNGRKRTERNGTERLKNGENGKKNGTERNGMERTIKRNGTETERFFLRLGTRSIHCQCYTQALNTNCYIQSSHAGRVTLHGIMLHDT